MIALYAMTSPNVVKVFIALEETGLPYEVKSVDVAAGDQFRPEFLALSPTAKVPVIVDSEGPGGKPYTVFESGAILIYLAEKTGKLLSSDPVARYDAIQWLMVQMAGVGPMFGQYVHFLRFAPAGSDYGLSRYRTQACRFCEVLDHRLARTPYLGGDEYSIADIATFPWVRNVPVFLADYAKSYPHLMAWVDIIAARPAVKRSIEIVEAMRPKLTAFDKGAPEILDRVFGRGAYAA